jgi:hypothetical protein
MLSYPGRVRETFLGTAAESPGRNNDDHRLRSKDGNGVECIVHLPDSFKMVDLERACPNVTREMIRVLLNR